MRTRTVVLVAFSIAAAAFADTDEKRFQVKADEFDPAHTHLVQAAWLQGIGCPTAAKTSSDGRRADGTFTDPACPTGDERDKNVEGLILAKTGPTTNVAAAFARIDGFHDDVVTELGWDIRKPGLTPPDTSAGARGSHCGAGAPRWNIETRDGSLFFVGCASAATPVAQERPGVGFIRMRWGASSSAISSTGAIATIGSLRVKSLSIVFDEGYDTGPDNFGVAILDNIDINGVLVGKGPTDADAK